MRMPSLRVAFRPVLVHRAALILAAAGIITGCRPGATASTGASADVMVGAAPGQVTDAERAAGWRPLFDGRSFAGWRGLGYAGVPSAHWTIEDGTIKKIASGKVAVQADGQPAAGGDLMTEATFRDFELVWDWKVTPGGNSGIKYNVSEELSMAIPPTHAAKGFEYQMLDDDRHADGKLPTHRAGALYDLIAPNANKRLNAVGEWNHSAIRFVGSHGEHWLNGQKVVEYELDSPAMKAALAASKYAHIPWFAERRAGHIVLQDHGDEVYFRGLRIRELPPAPRP
jgi:hypothetical protein